MSEWISVEERLPRTYEKVLVYGNRGGKTYIDVDCVIETIRGFVNATGLARVVTHWMPLPEPPADEYKPRHMREE